MYLPFVEPRTKKTRRQVVQFGGLNRTQDFRDGELVDAVGLSSREWPCLSQRMGRTRLQKNANPFTQVFAWDKLVTVDQLDCLWYGGEYAGKLTPGEKQFSVVNTKLCVFPDKKYLDLEDKKLKGLGANVCTVVSSVRFGEDFLELRADRSILGHHTMEQGGTTEFLDRYRFRAYKEENVVFDPESQRWKKEGACEEKTVWDLKKGDCLMLPRSYDRVDRDPEYEILYSAYQGFGSPLDEWGDYMYISAVSWEKGNSRSEFKIEMERRCADGKNPDFSEELQEGDTVTISGCETHEENNVDIRVSAVESGKVTFDSPVLTSGDEAGSVVLERRVPDLDFICESNNRLIGVSNEDKTIYISALGDPRNFYDYRGLSVSSSYIPVGSAGDFTGCIAYGGNVLIFKEDCIIRLMGDYDGNYAIYTDQVAGLQAGCERSLVIINEVLYYKGREGVYAYTGSTPRLISAALGDVAYQCASAGTDGRRYYISMMRTDTEEYELLVYDTWTGLWLKEEESRVDSFANVDGQLHMVNAQGGLYVLGEGAQDREGQNETPTPVRWEATFTPFDETVHERKYPSRLLLRLELGEGAWAEAELSRDGGPFQHIWTSHGRGQGPTAVIPIRPGRCDRYQLRLKGEGQCVLRSMEREFSVGGVR